MHGGVFPREQIPYGSCTLQLPLAAHACTPPCFCTCRLGLNTGHVLTMLLHVCAVCMQAADGGAVLDQSEDGAGAHDTKAIGQQHWRRVRVAAREASAVRRGGGACLAESGTLGFRRFTVEGRALVREVREGRHYVLRE